MIPIIRAICAFGQGSVAQRADSAPKGTSMSDVKQQIENRRSMVRVTVTYGAGLYIVLGSLGIIIADAFVEAVKLETAKEIFTLVLPVATGVITYWFASRRPAATGSAPDEQSQVLADSQENGPTAKRDGNADDDAGKAAIDKVAQD